MFASWPYYFRTNTTHITETEVEHSRWKEMHTLREEGREDEDKDGDVVYDMRKE